MSDEAERPEAPKSRVWLSPQAWKERRRYLEAWSQRMRNEIAAGETAWHDRVAKMHGKQ